MEIIEVDLEGLDREEVLKSKVIVHLMGNTDLYDITNIGNVLIFKGETRTYKIKTSFDNIVFKAFSKAEKEIVASGGEIDLGARMKSFNDTSLHIKACLRREILGNLLDSDPSLICEILNG